MKLLALLVAGFVSSSAAGAATLASEARQLEYKGDAAGARALLERAAQSASNAEARIALAEFLDRHRDPATREAYQKAFDSVQGEQRAALAHRMLQLDLMAGDMAAAGRHFDAYRQAGGSGLTLPNPAKRAGDSAPTVSIPGPLRSFSRMAALSPDLQPEDLLGALARNVVTNGYQAASSNESLEQTEYLKLVVRYLSQARELEKLAGQNQAIRIESCDSTQTADLLKTLGYRMRGGCGAEVVLETVNATRAFLTIDSGFPLADLEQALRTNRPFVYDYKPTRAPVLYTSEYWTGAAAKEGKGAGEFIDAFLADPSLCRLYLGMSKLDPGTAEALRKAVSVTRLKAFSHVLDFYGSMFEIRDGKALTPGGPKYAATWAELVGASPDNGTAFFDKLLARDDGWMASYYDSLARIQGPVRDYLLQPARAKRFYTAVRGRITSPGPARPVFRANTDMILLTTRLRLEPDGRAHVPGSLQVWKDLFVHHPHGKYDGKLTKAATSWKEPDDLIEALFALCRKAVENEPLKIYMAMSDINRRRTKPLAGETVDRMARGWRQFGPQYSVFAEVGSLSDETIVSYIDSAEAILKIRDQALRADAAGTMQALAGLWQIFCRQDSISAAEADGTLSKVLGPFGKIGNQRDVFEAGRDGVKTLLAATHSAAGANPHDRLIDLLAGASTFEDEEAHTQVISEMIRIFEAQRLIPVNQIFDLVDHLEAVNAKGAKLNTALLNRIATRISEIQPPRSSLSTAEKNTLAFGYWTERHIEMERKLNLRSLTDRNTEPDKVKDLRGQLAPLLRDTLVGLNYIHYAPPGAQVLLTNPLFVRTHDFIGAQGTVQTWRQTEVFGSGWPSSAGGRLVGSLAGLPYALAEAEQNFLIPSREQALIWGDLVPQIIQSATVSRYWRVTPAQTHWVGLHMQYAESALADAALDPQRRELVIGVLDQLAPPVRARKVQTMLAEGRVRAAIEEVTPSEMYALAVRLLPMESGKPLPLAEEIKAESSASPNLTHAEISRAFGTPKPTLTNSYGPELLGLRTFPTLMGYSSRIMAESWESSLLYFAALADELHMQPSQLNISVPEWTRSTVERIFATHLEDWPALLRSLRLVGDEVRGKVRKPGPATPAGGF